MPPNISVLGLHEGLWDAREEEEEEKEEEEAEPNGDEDPVVSLVFLGKPDDDRDVNDNDNDDDDKLLASWHPHSLLLHERTPDTSLASA